MTTHSLCERINSGLWNTASCVVFIVAAYAVLALPVAAADKPGKEELAGARAQCFAHEHRLQALQSQSLLCDNEEKLAKETAAAEQSCAHAEQLLEAAGLSAAPAQPQAAPPPPQIVVTEPVRTSDKAVAEIAAMEVERRPCPPKTE
jgi:hypothetical protein